MLKNKPHNIRFIDRLRSTPVLVITSFAVICLVFVVVPKIAHAVSCTSASNCQAQINNLSNQNSKAEQSINGLQSQAQSYQGAISQLDGQISSLQQALGANEAKQASLEQQIVADTTEINAKKATLSDDVKTMYLDGQMTTLEELATSSNLSDFVDKQQYQSVVQNQLSSIIQQISDLEKSLQSQKTQVDELVANEQTENSQLTSAQAQQQQLLGYNQSQQDAYNAQISADNKDVSQLTAQLIALNNSGSTTANGVCGGGYPVSTTSTITGVAWGCALPQDNTVDNWGMDNRECVSYTAYMANALYGISTKYWGNAYQWITAAENAGYVVNQTPSAGSIAIRNIDYGVPGDVGHAMYVVTVNGSDNITVEEYNEHYNGTFDERTFAPSSYDSRGGLYFIHF